jgi:hypothetical protein
MRKRRNPHHCPNSRAVNPIGFLRITPIAYATRRRPGLNPWRSGVAMTNRIVQFVNYVGPTSGPLTEGEVRIYRWSVLAAAIARDITGRMPKSPEASS